MPEPSYNIDELIGPIESEPPVIDILIKSWVAQLDIVYSTIQLTGLRYKLDSAQGDDLDDIWGRIFHIKRYASESDDDYRSRLIVFTKVLMGAGTIPNCEAIIDSLIGIPDAVSIESRWPGVLHVRFMDVQSLKLAKLAEEKIERIAPLMIAAGMSWDMLLPIVDYTLDPPILKCNSEKTYDIDVLMQGGKWGDYDIDARFILPQSTTYSLNSYLKTNRISSYSIMRGIMRFPKSTSYSLDALMQIYQSSDRSAPYSLNAYLQREQRHFYALTARFELPHTFYTLDVIFEAT